MKTKIGLRRELTHKISVWRGVESTPEAQAAAISALQLLQDNPWLKDQVSTEVLSALERAARSMTLGELRSMIGEIIKSG